MSDTSTPTKVKNHISHTSKIRVGLVGVGNWALYAHVRMLNLMPQYEMVAVYSQRAEAAQAAGRAHGIAHVAASLAELVNHPELHRPRLNNRPSA